MNLLKILLMLIFITAFLSRLSHRFDAPSHHARAGRRGSRRTALRASHNDRP
jgi:hypothetical protein